MTISTCNFKKIKSLSIDDMIKEISTKWLTSIQMEQLPDDVSILILEFND